MHGIKLGNGLGESLEVLGQVYFWITVDTVLFFLALLYTILLVDEI